MLRGRQPSHAEDHHVHQRRLLRLLGSLRRHNPHADDRRLVQAAVRSPVRRHVACCSRPSGLLSSRKRPCMTSFRRLPSGSESGAGTQPVPLLRSSRRSFTSCVGTRNAAYLTFTLFQTVLCFMCWDVKRNLSPFNAVPDCPFLHEPVSFQRCSRLSFTSCVGTWNAACLASMLFQTAFTSCVGTWNAGCLASALFQTVIYFMCWNVERSLSHFYAVPDCPFLRRHGYGTEPHSRVRSPVRRHVACCSRRS